jgi:DNA-binding MarR family transcriptional regulator
MPVPHRAHPLHDVADAVRALGLDPAQERVYEQVARSPGPTAQGCARRLHLPVAEVRRALAHLVELGLVREEHSDVPEYVRGLGVRPSGATEARYATQPPSAVLAALLRRQAADLVRAGATVERLGQLSTQPTAPGARPTGVADVVTGSAAVAAEVARLLATTRRELLHLDRQPFVRGAGGAQLRRAMVGVLDRGVRVRTIYARDALRMAGYASYMADAERLGEHARMLPHLPLRLVVCDRDTAVLPLLVDGPWVEAALVVRAPPLVDDLAQAFEQLWDRAGEDSATPPALDDAQAQLLRMLTADMTEGAIARHLGLSTRTVGRRVARLQRALGVRTRFGLGAEAARRGLV